MIGARSLATPWSRPGEAYSAPGSLVLKLPLGEAPEAIPTALDVRAGARAPAHRLGIGSIDRILGHFSDLVHITRVHAAAAGLTRRGAAHLEFDDLEHVLGLSRTFRVDAARDTPISDLVDALRQLATVEAATPQYLCQVPFTAGDGSGQAGPGAEERAWAARDQIGAAEAMAYEPGDPAMLVAIVDTGVATDHPELRDRLRPGLDTVQLGTGDLATGIQLFGDTSHPDNDPSDEVGHGTSCAAIIGAAGLGLPAGLAGACGLLPIRVLGSAGFPGKAGRVGIGSMTDINCGMKAAMDLGAKVLNLSFGTPETALGPGSEDPHRDVVRYGLARGCIMVAASGNSAGPDRFTPSCLDGVIAVGAVAADGRPAPFSTRGEHVDLAAPGERVVSAGLGGYALVTGTSFAAPFVAAAAALLVSRAARRAHALDGREVRRILTASARLWPEGSAGGHGVGVLDAYTALRVLDAEIDAAASPESDLVPAARGP
jgi:subtilisin family serine protease